MTEDDALKREHQRGYSAGYAAGKKNVVRQRRLEHSRRERQAFYDRAFIAVLNFSFTQDCWQRGQKPILTVDQRVALADEIAAAALKIRRYVS